MNTRKVRFVRLFRNNTVLVLSKITHCRIFKANKGNIKITELQTILKMESQTS